MDSYSPNFLRAELIKFQDTDVSYRRTKLYCKNFVFSLLPNKSGLLSHQLLLDDIELFGVLKAGYELF